MPTAYLEQRAYREGLEAKAKSHVCATCGGGLSLARKPLPEGGYTDALKCYTCGYDPLPTSSLYNVLLERYLRKGIKKLSASDQRILWTGLDDRVRWKQKASEDAAYEEEILANFEQDMEALMSNKPVSDHQALISMDGESRAIIPRLLAKWSRDLNKANVGQFLAVCLQLDLNPWLGEIVPFQGVPYVTVKGYTRKARESKLYKGIKTRPATDDERRLSGCSDDDILWTATTMDIAGGEYQGWGRITMAERQATVDRRDGSGTTWRNPVIAAKPMEMAETRAVHDALERAGFIYEMATDILPFVDPSTGELLASPSIESQADEVSLEPDQWSPSSAETEPQPSFDNTDDGWKALRAELDERFGLSREAVAQEMGFATVRDLVASSSPQDVWDAIVSVRQ